MPAEQLALELMAPTPPAVTGGIGLPEGTETGTCAYCLAKVAWTRHVRTGNRMPVDLHGTDDGNVWLLPGGLYEVLNNARRAVAVAAGELLRMSHMVTCPDRPRAVR